MERFVFKKKKRLSKILFFFSNILYRRWIFFSPAPSSLNSRRFPSFPKIHAAKFMKMCPWLDPQISSKK